MKNKNFKKLLIVFLLIGIISFANSFFDLNLLERDVVPLVSGDNLPFCIIVFEDGCTYGCDVSSNPYMVDGCDDGGTCQMDFTCSNYEYDLPAACSTEVEKIGGQCPGGFCGDGTCDIFEQTYNYCSPTADDCICEDFDQDGYGSPASDQCSAGSNLLDCVYNNENINPGATEICDGIDNNCDGIIDEGCSPFAGGLGTEAEPYLISTCIELQAIDDDDQDTYLGNSFELTGNINCAETINWNEGSGFDPIGSVNLPFTGTFDGQNFEIQNLYINRGLEVGGLFLIVTGNIKDFYLDNSVMYLSKGGLIAFWMGGNLVENVNVSGQISCSESDPFSTPICGGMFGGGSSSGIINSNSEVSVTGHDHVGGLVGKSEEYFQITNSYATGSVTGNDHVGGLVGKSEDNSPITNSYATGSVTGNDYVGGLVGKSEDNSPITNSYATGSVMGTIRIGGLVGWVGWADSPITNSYATGSVTGGFYSVGGLVGLADSPITNSYATGSVTGGGNNVGGLVGAAGNTVPITNSYATGYVTGHDHVGGLVGWVGWADSPITNSYATGSVTGNDYVGGLVGKFHNAILNSILNSYATGSVTGNDYVGGLGGYIMRSSSVVCDPVIQNVYSSGFVDSNYPTTSHGLIGFLFVDAGGCNPGVIVSKTYYDTEISGRGDMYYSTPKTTAQMMTQSTFVNWPWDSIWDIQENITYPYFQWSSPSGDEGAEFDPSSPYLDIQNNGDVSVARIDQNGVMDISGSLQTWSSSFGVNDFVIKNNVGDVVAWIDADNGNLYLQGSLNENSVSSPSSSGNFVIQDSNDVSVAWFDSSGNLYLKSSLI